MDKSTSDEDTRYDYDENTRNEYIGDCVAYMDTGKGLTGTLVEYKIKFRPTGELLAGCPVEHRVGEMPESQIAVIVSALSSKEDVIHDLQRILEVIREQGLYLGNWPCQDYNNPYLLFDKGDRVVTKQEP